MGNWTYYPTKLATSLKDQVRFLIGDTVSTDQQLFDEEINLALQVRPSIWGAASMCCLALADKFSRSVDQSAGNNKASYSQMSKAYTTRAAWLNALAAQFGSGMPYAGGLSLADMMNQLANDDRISPAFTIGFTDNWLPVAPAGGETETGSNTSEGIS